VPNVDVFVSRHDVESVESVECLEELGRVLGA
jgi:hypothetical protein